MQRNITTQARQGSALLITVRAVRHRRILPGDSVLIYDALIAQNVWIEIDDVLIAGESTKLRSGNMNFYFDDSLIIAHQKGRRN